MHKFNTVLIIIFLMGCRGTPFEQPAVSLLRNMDDQTSFGPQSQNSFYKDKMSYRKPPPGVVAQGEENLAPLDNDPERNKIKSKKELPFKLTEAVLKSGEKHYNISCSPCHGLSGRANGLVTQRAAGSIRPPGFHESRVLNLSIGEIYDAITYGVNNGNMPAFKYLNEKDRWAVASYVRALQQLQEQGGS